MKATLYVEYQGNQIDDKSILAKIKETWLEEGNKVKDIKDLKMYVKPEENAVYYVINDTVSKKLELI